jgi:hypothetical protein
MQAETAKVLPFPSLDWTKALFRFISARTLPISPSRLRGGANRLASFRTWQPQRPLNSLRIVPCDLRYSPIGARFKEWIHLNVHQISLVINGGKPSFHYTRHLSF